MGAENEIFVTFDIFLCSEFYPDFYCERNHRIGHVNFYNIGLFNTLCK